MKNRQRLFYLATCFLVAGAFFFKTSLVRAAQGNPTDVTVAVNSLIAGYGKNMTENYLFKATPSIELSKGYGEGQKILMPKNQTALIPYMPDDSGIIAPGVVSKPLNTQAIFDILAATGETKQARQMDLNRKICLRATGAASTQRIQFPGLPLVSPTECSSVDSIETAQNYDSRSLLGPLGYSDDKAVKTALAYIEFASNLVQPFEADLAALQKANKGDMKKMLPYLTAVRAYAAAQSNGLNNLYHSYIQRVRINGLGGKAGISKDSDTPASPLEVEEYNAKWRLMGEGDSAWLAQMEKASPATLARANIYLLAEMRLEAFKTRMALERLIVTNSLIQLQLSRLAATSAGAELSSLKQQAGLSFAPPEEGSSSYKPPSPPAPTQK